MSSRARKILIVVLLLLALLLLLFFGRCRTVDSPAPMRTTSVPTPVPPAGNGASPAGPTAPAAVQEERLTPATIALPAEVAAGAAIRATWMGPDNAGDYLTIVRPSAGAAEVRYMSGKGNRVLARAAIELQ